MKRPTIINFEKKQIGNEDGIKMIELCRGLTELKEELSDLRGQVNKMNPICDAFNTVRRTELRSAAGIGYGPKRAKRNQFVHGANILGDLIAIDEVGYVPLAEVGAEFLFQVVAERAEKAAVILTTNLPFSEWTQVIPNARLCKALLDRITDRAHILETGTESYRFRRTAEKLKKGAKTH